MHLTPLEFTLIVFAASLVAGLIGSLLGLGGAFIVVPVLVLAMKIDIRYAIGASLVAVIATSSGAAAAYVKEGMTNLRVAMFLETATAAGAITGAFINSWVSTRALFVIFGLLLSYSAVIMLRKSQATHHLRPVPDRLADRLQLHGQFYDRAEQRMISYQVAHTRLGWCLMYVAGIASGLLGIGSGVLKVPTMDLAMGMPIKASSATSNFMIGVTAAASAGVYFSRGDINPFIAGPVAMGVLIGSVVGSRLLGGLEQRSIRIVFVLVLLYVAGEMLLKGVRG
jgi:uncharacterized membrane protein YfcA